MNEQTPEPSAKKRSMVSVPFLLFAVALLVGGALGGPWLMTQVMFLQEQSIAAQGTVSFSVPTERPKLDFSGGAGGGSSSGASQGGSDGEKISAEQLEASFTEWDADKNNKLEEDEILERLKGRMDELDSDKDGAISKDEFMAGMKVPQADSTMEQE
jgi:hypothetical protein